MKQRMMIGVIITLVGIGAATLVYAISVRKDNPDPDKEIDGIIDYCRHKVDSLDNMLKTIPAMSAPAAS